MSTTPSQIADLLCSKATLKQDVFQNTTALFGQLKTASAALAEWMYGKVCDLDSRVLVEYEDLNDYECSLKFGGDLLYIHHHTNVFTLDRKSLLWNKDYIKEKPSRSFFGVLHFYNFMADSFKYHRSQDAGVLLGRLFVNADGHYFIEGIESLDRPMRTMEEQELNQAELQRVLEILVQHALNHDLTAPAIKDIALASVGDMKARASELQMRTGKKLGFKP